MELKRDEQINETEAERNAENAQTYVWKCPKCGQSNSFIWTVCKCKYVNPAIAPMGRPI